CLRLAGQRARAPKRHRTIGDSDRRRCLLHRRGLAEAECRRQGRRRRRLGKGKDRGSPGGNEGPDLRASRSGDDARHSASDAGVADPRTPHQQAPVQIFLAARQMPSICTPARAIAPCTSACGNGSPIARQVRMPMIDVYAVADLFPADADRQLAEELTLALLKAEGVEKPGPTHLNNTGAYIHRMPPSAVNTAAGEARTVRVQVLTPPGVLDRAGQKQLVAEVTQIVAKISGDPTQAGRTWV